MSGKDGMEAGQIVEYGTDWAAYVADCALKEAKTIIDITSTPA